jgi:serine/threonine protein kinase
MWLHEIIDDPNKKELYLVTEFYKGGSLGDKVTQRNVKREEHNTKCKLEGRFDEMITFGLNDWDARLYFIDMLKALEYCHDTIEVIHRDIKPENIMINHNNEAVLIDFGVSAIVEH